MTDEELKEKIKEVLGEMGVWSGHREMTVDEIATIQPGLARIMPEVGQRTWKLYYAAKAENWALATFQAKEIKGLIQDSVQKVRDGSELVNKSGQTLGEIVAGVRQVTGIVSEIAASSEEQSRGIEQVNRAVTLMDQVVQSNAAQTEELSSTAQNLTGQARELQELVRRFRVVEGAPDPGPDRVPVTRRSKPRAALARSGNGDRRPKPPEPTLVAGRPANGSPPAWDSEFEEF